MVFSIPIIQYISLYKSHINIVMFFTRLIHIFDFLLSLNKSHINIVIMFFIRLNHIFDLYININNSKFFFHTVIVCVKNKKNKF